MNATPTNTPTNETPNLDDLAVDANHALANLADRYGLTVPEHVLDTLAYQVHAAFTRSPATPAQALADERGSIAEGYDDADMNRLCDLLTEAYGLPFVCVWEYQGSLGFHGQSAIYVVGTDGLYYPLSPALWDFLHDGTSQPPTTAEDAVTHAGEDLGADWAAVSGHNRARSLDN